MDITLYHNPACSTSRKALAALQDAGHQPVVIDYLKAGWTRPQLEDLFAAAGLTPREALRTRGALAGDLGLLESSVPDEALLEAMVAHPVLVERPFVQTPDGARLCRPLERLFELVGLPDSTSADPA